MFPKYRFNLGQRRGAALVIVLAFVVLLTGLVVALFTNATASRQLTSSSVNHTKVDELARTGLSIVTGYLKVEITDPAASDAKDVNGIITYEPKSGARMMPVKAADIPATMPTLLRVSSPTALTAPGQDLPSANASSDQPSANGRWISLARWNRHLLLPTANPTQAGQDATPAAGFPVPNWVFVNDQGPTTLTAPDPKVIGRYAYAVYDVSGLLDVNVAGYPSVLPNTRAYPSPDPYNFSRLGYAAKGSLAYADLTQLTPAGDGAVTVAQIDKFLGWRNFASAVPDGNFPDFTFSDSGAASGSAASYFRAVQRNGDGFLRVADVLRNGASDQRVLSRQQLVSLWKTMQLPASMLQYFTVFNRAVTTPSWAPRLNASEMKNRPGARTLASPIQGPYPAVSARDISSGNNGPSNQYAYRDNADNKTAANRNLLNLRVQAVTTITHYKDDGTKERYSVPEGGQAVQRRFSLAKLAWLGFNGPNAAAFSSEVTESERAAAIRSCFGLVWKPSTSANTGPYWEYVANSTSPFTIKTLEQVATEGREPNFFETLKAGILSGSLGLHPGQQTGGVGTPPPSGAGKSSDLEGTSGYALGPLPNGDPGFSQDKDRHVMQIGANIIDQADPDGYPTGVLFDAFAFPDPILERVYNTVYGNENLPYINKLWFLFGDEPNPAAASGLSVSTWIQPEIWNLHQSLPSGAFANGNIPTKFRVRAYGRGRSMYIYQQVNKPETQLIDTADYRDYDNNGTPNPDGLVYFQDPNNGKRTSGFYNNPRAIQTMDLDTSIGSTQVQNRLKGEVSPYPMDKNSGLNGMPLNYFVGIWGGQTKQSPKKPMDQAITCRYYFDPVRFTVSLECWDGSAWRPYNFVSRLDCCWWADPLLQRPGMETYTGPVGMTRNNSINNYLTYLTSDPRTDRLSMSAAMGQDNKDRPAPNTSDENWYNCVGLAHGMFIPQTDNHGFNTGFNFSCISPYVNGSTDIPADYIPPLRPNRMTVHYSNWAMNDSDPSRKDGAKLISFYLDPDGLVRPGDGFFRSEVNNNTGDGFLLMHASNQPATSEARRPVILNRPFRSVGELGYVYRDVPMKTLDMFSRVSGDAALLDLFSVADEPLVTGGMINPNAAPAAVLHAIVAGTLQNESDTLSGAPATPTLLGGGDGSEAQAIAKRIAAYVTDMSDPARGPLRNISELVTRLGAGGGQDGEYQLGFKDISTDPARNLTTRANKTYVEAPLRALSSISNTRTWNLMIDVIAQTGKFPRKATGNTGLNSSFTVQGERRYWLHVAIDRFTGEVVDQQLEPVYE